MPANRSMNARDGAPPHARTKPPTERPPSLEEAKRHFLQADQPFIPTSVEPIRQHPGIAAITALGVGFLLGYSRRLRRDGFNLAWEWVMRELSPTPANPQPKE